MNADFKPKLRMLEFTPIEHNGEEYFHVHDRLGFTQDLLLPRIWGGLLVLMDGTRDIPEIILSYSMKHQEILPREAVEKIVEQLDEALLLDSPHFRSRQRNVVQEFVESRTRRAMFGDHSYPDAYSQKELIGGFMEAAREIKPMSPRPIDARVSGIVVPHIDFQRGGVTEALAYNELLKSNQSQTSVDFDTFVVLGIAHSGVRYPFCATDKDFETPLGTAQCDRDFLEQLDARVGGKMLDEQYAHKNEHSVEFVAVFLQAIAQFSDAKIVPIICGGFFDELSSGDSPMNNPEITEFVKALREVVEEHTARGKKIGLIASVDLAHVGSRFGDNEVLTPQRLETIREADLKFLRCTEAGDAEGIHRELSRDNNVRNVDAHPAVYTLLAAFPELRAQLLDYQQAFDKEANSVVSFAAMTLYQ